MITLCQAKQLYTSPLLRHSSPHEYMIRETNRSFESDLFNEPFEPVKTAWTIRSRMIRSVTETGVWFVMRWEPISELAVK